MSLLLIVSAVILVALFFDFINGFHDAANAIATVVATRVLSPLSAVALAAFMNFIGAFIFSVSIAETVGKGIIDPSIVSIQIIFSALVGAIVWNLITWWKGLPSSSSHALIGGLVGAGTAAAGTSVIVFWGVFKTFTFIFVAPTLGLIGAIIFAIIVFRLARKSSPLQINSVFKRLQLLSASFYALGHGTNDAQKTMGIIAVLLFSQGFMDHFHVPLWIILSAHAAIALGTFAGGWRIIRTMGSRITKLRPVDGFCAETAGGIVLAGAAHFGIPVSTTHVIAGSIMGVGTVKRTSAVRWIVARKILWAWILTIPASAIIAAATLILLNFILGFF